MTLHAPFFISSRLLPALKAGSMIIQLAYSKRPGRQGRVRYAWTIDLDDGQSFSDDDLQSGGQGGDLLDGFKSLLSFLSASGESYAHRTFRTKETEVDPDSNESLFPAPIPEACHQNDSELSMLQLHLEESGADLLSE